MFTQQTDSDFEKWVESGLSTFETRRLVAEIYFNSSCWPWITYYDTLLQALWNCHNNHLAVDSNLKLVTYWAHFVAATWGFG